MLAKKLFPKMVWALCVLAASCALAEDNTVTVITNGVDYGGNYYDVGYSGTNNHLTISGGGALTNVLGGYIGTGSGANNNAATVSGTGSVWSNSAEFVVGFYGSGNSLTITNDGKVYNASTGYIGYDTLASNNAVTVSGIGSVWSNSSDLYVGYLGSGNRLTINNGGAVYNTFGTIGFNTSTSNNAVTVSGAGSVWRSSSSIIVGFAGSGSSLAVSDGGRVSASNVVIGQSSSSGNSITVAGGGTLLTTNASGSSTLTVKHGTLAIQGGTVTTEKLVANNGTNSVVRFTAGTLNAAGAQVNNGAAFRVGDGTQVTTYNLNGGSHTFQNGMVISSNAALRGNGLVDKATIEAGGRLAPGNSIGALSFSNLLLNTGAVIDQEIFSAFSFDQVAVSMLTASNGVIWNLTLAGDVLPQDSLITLFQIGDYSGTSTDWLSLGGTNILTEGEVFSLTTSGSQSQAFQISYLGGSGHDVTLQAVPEPAVALLFGIGGIGAWLLRRNLRRVKEEMGDTI